MKKKLNSSSNEPSGKKKAKKSVWVCAVLLAIIIVVAFFGKGLISGTVSDETEEEALMIVYAFEKKDINAITKCVFGDLDNDADLAVDTYGMMAAIFEKTSVELTSISKDTITYTVSAANLSQIFNDWIAEDPQWEEIDEFGFVAHIMEYVEKAEIEEQRVKVPYTTEDGRFVAEYTSFEFLDAITGQFLTAYEEQYSAMMDGYREALGEEDVQ